MTRMTVTISARRLKALTAAENVARAYRAYVSTPVCDSETREQASKLALDWTLCWLEQAPKAAKFLWPPDLPKRWKYNRDKAMHGWPDKASEGAGEKTP